MNPHPDKPIDRILHDLQERAKELNCLYRVDELLGREDAPVDEVLGEVVPPRPEELRLLRDVLDPKKLYLA